MDFGTSSIKFNVLDENFTILKSIKVPYQIRVFNNDWVELDGNVVFKSMLQGIRQFNDYLTDLDLIGFDNFSPSMILMDNNGDPLYPIITHLDRRSKKQTSDILNRMGSKKFQAVTGIQPFTGGASITSLLWIKENLPEVFKSANFLGHLNTYIYRKLTDKWYSDPVNASMSGMYETISGRGWSDEIIEAFSIPKRLFPEIIDAGTNAGYLSREIANLCGLKKGIPVALGTNDAASAQIGAGNHQHGDILNISGSSEMISILTRRPHIDSRYYLRCAAEPGLWQIYATTAGGFALDWFRNTFYRDITEIDFFQKELPKVVDNYLERTGVKFLPYLAGDRQSLTPKKGAFNEITLETSREDFFASILLGMHEPMEEIINLCNSFMVLNDTIKLTGGMLDPIFLRVKQKIFKAYRFEIVQDAPVIGSAVLAFNKLNQSQLKEQV
jgi:sugar (pentulose or hexulose) kinase